MIQIKRCHNLGSYKANRKLLYKYINLKYVIYYSLAQEHSEQGYTETARALLLKRYCANK